MKIKELEQTITLYDSLKRTKHDYYYFFNHYVLNEVGYYYLNKQKHDLAIQIFERNVEIYPNEANTHDSLGEAYLASNKKEEAIASFKKALKIDATFKNSKKHLARLNVNTN